MGREGKASLLYVMGIDWNWIFQRPQIIAHYLEQSYEVTVVFPQSILKLFHRKKEDYPKQYQILWTLPFQEKISIIGKLSRLLNRHIFRGVLRYEMIVIGFPLYYRYIPRNYCGTLIYDCMDNHEALYRYRRGMPELLRQEKELIAHSSLVFTSSLQLMKKLQQYKIDTMPQIILMRNGVMEAEQLQPIACPIYKGLHEIGYFGTIAEWFDKKLILESLQLIDDIEYHLIGPVNIELPEDEGRLIAEGVICHEQLYDAVKSYSCLIMPFLVNETVMCVDPVKLYEYIAMGKCIVAVFYEEIERFQDFVYFYHSGQEYICLLKELKQQGFPPKYNERQRQAFLEENSWAARFAVWDKAVREASNK